jgi:hypothetical protein
LQPPGASIQRASNFQVSQVYRPSSQASNQLETEELRQKLRSQAALNEALQRQLQDLQNEQRMIYGSSEFGRIQ